MLLHFRRTFVSHAGRGGLAHRQQAEALLDVSGI